MKKILKKNLANILDPTLFRFVVVGVINTVFGTSIMFVSYNLLGFSYWFSVGANYFFGSILSFYLNKHFTFRSQEKGVKPLLRFTLNILVCSLLAYGIAKPCVRQAVANLSLSQTIQDNLSMMVGMVLFVGLNYFGQRFFAFKQK